MSETAVDRLIQIKTFPALVKYLRDELDWPVDSDDIDDLTFDYTPEELGVDEKHAAKIKEIKQLRPLETGQPWGIFWVNFEKKQLPMVVLRRILGKLVIKRRVSANDPRRPAWELHDLLFISSYGEEEHRTVSFAHFKEDPDTQELPVLRVLGWDDQNTKMHFDRVANRLHSNLRWPDDISEVEAWREQWSGAFTDRYREAIISSEELIKELAKLAAGIRRRVRDVLDAETARGPMRRIFTAMQKLLIHDMNEDGFADMYAQTVSYGLLSAKFSRPAGLTAQNLVQLTAVSNPFLENLLENLFRLNRGKFHFDIDEVGINDVLELLNRTNIEAIKAAFSDKNPAEDPVIKFYEGFLKAYDSKQRVKRGVFFTPRPVVSYIVRSVHELLQTEFGLEDGLASTDTWADMQKRLPDLTIPQGAEPGDAFVCILDPATGTGTFLFECIEVIERAMKNKWQKEIGCRDWNNSEIKKRWQEYVPAHLLTRLYGYELMMAPYSIAHLKLALKLGETGYQFSEGDRLHIYLTNSLEPPTIMDRMLADMFTTLANEAQEVNEVKRHKRFTVVIGNPPYSISSLNAGSWITDLLDCYKKAVRHEKNIQPLSDDYIKFIRMAHHLIENSYLGVFGYVTNHTFLNGLIHRGMRQCLIAAFDCIHVLDLHGSSLLGLKTPEGKEDKNVFEIQQGVAVMIACSLGQRRVSSQQGLVRHEDLWGTREHKYTVLQSINVGELNETVIFTEQPNAFFTPSQKIDPLYEHWLSLSLIFSSYSTGFETGRDAVLISFEKQQIEHLCNDLHNKAFSDNKIAETYCLGDTSGWPVSARRARLQKEPVPQLHKHIRKVLYRPFDKRHTIYTDFIRRAQFENMRHMLQSNLGFVTSRIIKGETPAHCFISDAPIEKILISPKTSNNAFLFPLYLYADNQLFERIPGSKNEKLLNIKQQFVNHFPKGIPPENIFFYIYSVFHSPEYRRSYAEFLKIDFPRVPLISNLDLFRNLAELGCELVALHLMESPELKKHITKWKGETPSGEIEKITYSDNTVWIDKGKTEGFLGVPEDVWNFHVGGYQVCEKWLKDRGPKGGKPGRRLSAEDIEHYQRVVVSLNETIRVMGEIDKVIEKHGGWPDAFITDPKVYEKIRAE